MATVRFTEEDRDTRGFIRLSPPEVAEAVPDALAPDVAAPLPRANRPSATTRPPLSPRLRYQLTMAASSIAGLLLVLLTMRMSLPRQIVPSVATPAPAALLPTPNPQPPTPAAVMLPAYAAPGGAELGKIEATRDITPTAHYGDDWIQADVKGSGRIWLRVSDWPQLAIVGPDLAPKPTATARPYVPPTMEPQPPCLTAGSGAQVVTVCDWLSDEELRIAAAAKWVSTYGGNIGTVSTPSPQVR